MKKYLIALPILAASSVGAFELGNGVSLNGSAEADFFFRTNQTTGGTLNPDRTVVDSKTGINTLMEVDIILNIDGKHESDFGNVIWRLGQKVSSDYRYDKFGTREAWVGLDNDKFGKLLLGNQFSNIYLAKDNLYGHYAARHLYSALGFSNKQYTRAITYVTPNFRGFNLALQYDLGGYGANQNTSEIHKSYAYEALLTYSNEHNYNALTANLGYYAGKNNGTLALFSDAFNGTRTVPASNISALNNDIMVVILDGTYKIALMNDKFLDFTLGYTYNQYKGEAIYINPVLNLFFLNSGKGKVKNSQAIAKVGFGFGKNYFNLGYQLLTATKGDALNSAGDVVGNMSDATTNISTISILYNRQLSDNVTTFVQARHTIYNKARATPTIDGKNLDKKDVSILSFGIYVGF